MSASRLVQRDKLAAYIFDRLSAEKDRLAAQWRDSGPISYFVIDDLLPQDWALAIREAFPSGEAMKLKKSIRELKYIAAQMDSFDPILEEAVYAFQSPDIVNLVEAITGLKALEPDHLLYAGGVSLMAPGHFLNPHVDNSHDKFRDRYRVMNLLYYVSPEWSEERGANLELWPDGPEGQPLTIVSRFNRLVVMVTHEGSWHSVSRNRSLLNRCCVSNYYFSSQPVGGREYFHVTSFRGRPDQPFRDLILRADIWLRMALRKIFPKGIKENPHYYNRKQ